MYQAFAVIFLFFYSSPTLAKGLPWVWTPITEAEFYADLVPEMNLPLHWEYLKNDAPEVVAMNDIANRIDRHLRLQNPAALMDVPSPRVKVSDYEDIQASAVAARICIDLPLRLDSSGVGVAEFAEVTRDDTIEPLRRQYAKCVHLTRPEEIQTFIAWFNNEHSGCHLTVVGEGGNQEVVPGDGCKFDQRITGKIARAKVLTVKANAPWVIVDTGVSKVAQTPDQIAFVVAHELAHYYQAHYSRSQSHYTPGHYSHEDEADELATRWLAAIGLDSHAGIDFFKNYLQLFPESAGASADISMGGAYAVHDGHDAHSGPSTRIEHIARVMADLAQGE